MLRRVERFAAHEFLYLPRGENRGSRLKSPPHNSFEGQRALIFDAERHARMRCRVEDHKAHERIPEAEQQKSAVNHIINARQVVILLFVKNHKTVMLFDQMIISPKRGEEEKLQTIAREIKRWAEREE